MKTQTEKIQKSKLERTLRSVFIITLICITILTLTILLAENFKGEREFGDSIKRTAIFIMTGLGALAFLSYAMHSRVGEDRRRLQNSLKNQREAENKFRELLLILLEKHKTIASGYKISLLIHEGAKAAIDSGCSLEFIEKELEIRKTQNEVKMFKKTVIWTIINRKLHPNITHEDSKRDSIIQIIRHLFPGMSYIGEIEGPPGKLHISEFRLIQIQRDYLKPVMKKLFPDLINSNPDEINPDDLVSIRGLLPSNKDEDLENPEWKKRFTELLEKI